MITTALLIAGALALSMVLCRMMMRRSHGTSSGSHEHHHSETKRHPTVPAAETREHGASMALPGADDHACCCQPAATAAATPDPTRATSSGAHGRGCC